MPALALLEVVVYELSFRLTAAIRGLMPSRVLMAAALVLINPFAPKVQGMTAQGQAREASAALGCERSKDRHAESVRQNRQTL